MKAPTTALLLAAAAVLLSVARVGERLAGAAL